MELRCATDTAQPRCVVGPDACAVSVPCRLFAISKKQAARQSSPRRCPAYDEAMDHSKSLTTTFDAARVFANLDMTKLFDDLAAISQNAHLADTILRSPELADVVASAEVAEARPAETAGVAAETFEVSRKADPLGLIAPRRELTPEEWALLQVIVSAYCPDQLPPAGRARGWHQRHCVLCRPCSAQQLPHTIDLRPMSAPRRVVPLLRSMQLSALVNGGARFSNSSKAEASATRLSRRRYYERWALSGIGGAVRDRRCCRGRSCCDHARVLQYLLEGSLRLRLLLRTGTTC